MKIDTALLAALLLTGTGLLSRIATQGVEQALVSTAIEYGLESVKLVARLVR